MCQKLGMAERFLEGLECQLKTISSAKTCVSFASITQRLSGLDINE